MHRDITPLAVHTMAPVTSAALVSRILLVDDDDNLTDVVSRYFQTYQ